MERISKSIKLVVKKRDIPSDISEIQGTVRKNIEKLKF
jgi:hypothetical protein